MGHAGLVECNNPTPRGDDRERITRARQAVEALLTLERQIAEQSVSDSPAADRSAPTPRVLRTSPAAPVRDDEIEVALARAAAVRDPAVAICASGPGQNTAHDGYSDRRGRRRLGRAPSLLGGTGRSGDPTSRPRASTSLRFRLGAAAVTGLRPARAG